MQLFYGFLNRPVALAAVSATGVASLTDKLGVWGMAIGVFLNGVGVPGLSEVLVPLSGVAVRRGHESLWVVFVVAMVAQLVGVSIAYWIGRSGGVKLIERYGKYVLVSHRDLMAAQRAFAKYGTWLIVVGSFVPGVQGFIGYAAGVGEMRYERFILAVLVGKMVWLSGLLYIGMVLGNHLDLIDRSLKQIGVVILVAVIVAIIWYVRQHRTPAVSRLTDAEEEK